MSLCYVEFYVTLHAPVHTTACCFFSSGVSPDPDSEGFYTYTRPEGKSGGHGVGWSEMPRYTFKVAEGWEETPVSIADLGGTEASDTSGKI